MHNQQWKSRTLSPSLQHKLSLNHFERLNKKLKPRRHAERVNFKEKQIERILNQPFLTEIHEMFRILLLRQSYTSSLLLPFAFCNIFVIMDHLFLLKNCYRLNAGFQFYKSKQLKPKSWFKKIKNQTTVAYI